MEENPYRPSLEYGNNPDFVPPPAVLGAKPVSVTVFGVLHLIFGGFGLLSAISMVGMMAFVAGQSNQPMTQWVVVTANGLLNLATSCLLLAGGVGLLRWKPFGRKLSVIYGYVSVVGTILMTVANLVMQFLVMTEAANMPPNMLAITIAGTIIGLFVGLTYPILVLVFMNTQKVRAALAEDTITSL